MILLKTDSPSAAITLLKRIYDIDAKVVSGGVKLPHDVSAEVIGQIRNDWPDLVIDEDAPIITDAELKAITG